MSRINNGSANLLMSAGYASGANMNASKSMQEMLDRLARSGVKLVDANGQPNMQVVQSLANLTGGSTPAAMQSAMRAIQGSSMFREQLSPQQQAQFTQSAGVTGTSGQAMMAQNADQNISKSITDLQSAIQHVQNNPSSTTTAKPAAAAAKPTPAVSGGGYAGVAQAGPVYNTTGATFQGASDGYKQASGNTWTVQPIANGGTQAKPAGGAAMNPVGNQGMTDLQRRLRDSGTTTQPAAGNAQAPKSVSPTPTVQAPKQTPGAVAGAATATPQLAIPQGGWLNMPGQSASPTGTGHASGALAPSQKAAQAMPAGFGGGGYAAVAGGGNPSLQGMLNSANNANEQRYQQLLGINQYGGQQQLDALQQGQQAQQQALTNLTAQRDALITGQIGNLQQTAQQQAYNEQQQAKYNQDQMVKMREEQERQQASEIRAQERRLAEQQKDATKAEQKAAKDAESKLTGTTAAMKKEQAAQAAAIQKAMDEAANKAFTSSYNRLDTAKGEQQSQLAATQAQLEAQLAARADTEMAREARLRDSEYGQLQQSMVGRGLSNTTVGDSIRGDITDRSRLREQEISNARLAQQMGITDTYGRLGLGVLQNDMSGRLNAIQNQGSANVASASQSKSAGLDALARTGTQGLDVSNQWTGAGYNALLNGNQTGLNIAQQYGNMGLQNSANSAADQFGVANQWTGQGYNSLLNSNQVNQQLGLAGANATLQNNANAMSGAMGIDANYYASRANLLGGLQGDLSRIIEGRTDAGPDMNLWANLLSQPGAVQNLSNEQLEALLRQV